MADLIQATSFLPLHVPSAPCWPLLPAIVTWVQWLVAHITSHHLQAWEAKGSIVLEAGCHLGARGHLFHMAEDNISAGENSRFLSESLEDSWARRNRKKENL